MSAFEKWFVDQHGPRTRRNTTDHQLRDAMTTGQDAERELRARQEWDSRRESALYAWQAKHQSEEGNHT